MVWYYVKDGARQGPVEEAEFSRLVAQSIVRPDTLVWSEGMPDWSPYSAVVPAAPPAPAVDPIVPMAAEVRAEPQSAIAEVVPVQQEIEPYAAAPVPAPASTQVYCSQCGQPYRSEEMIRFGSTAVCANCKDVYAQRLRETGQVAGARVYGGFWIRFVAVLIDGIALWIVNFAIQIATGMRATATRDLASMMGTMGLNFLISISISLFYEAFFLVQYGATPGKMIFSLKVITPDGGGISWGRAVGRYFAKWLSGITLCIGYIMAAFDVEKRALHDYIAGTRVVRAA